MTDIEAIATKLKGKSKSAKIIRAVATDIFYSGSPEEILANDDVIDGLFKRHKIKEAHKKGDLSVSASNPDLCPICRTRLEAVLLCDDQPAVWCKRHMVVFPTKPKEKRA